jgi:hypothetical protein
MRQPTEKIVSLDIDLNRKLEAANTAVIEFFIAARDSGDPLLPMLFGLSDEAFKAWTANRLREVPNILRCGLPLFEMRLKTPQALALLSQDNITHPDVLACLTATFPIDLGGSSK